MNRMLVAIIVLLVFGAVPAHAEEPLKVFLAGAHWGVEIPGEGLQVNPQATSITETTARIVAADPTTGLNCSMDILPAAAGGGNIGAQGAYITRNKKRMGMSDLETNNDGQFAILEFMRKKVQGTKQNEKNVLISLAHQGSWVYVKLWKRDFQEEDQPIFDRIVEGVRLIERQESDFTSAELAEPGMPSGETRQIFLPGASWALEMPDHGFTVDPLQTAKTTEALNWIAENRMNDSILTAFIAPAAEEGDSAKAREVYFDAMKQAPMEYSDVKTWEKEPFAILEYSVKELEGVEVNGKGVHIYLSHQGSWVDVHMSKPGFTDEDRPFFDTFVEGVRLIERTESELTSAEYILLGNEAALQGLCEEANANYRVALAINKTKTQMKKEDYIETVRYLGICYRESGELEKAMSTLRSGIQQDAKNHRLHYELARTYAKLGEEGKAVASLTTAYDILAADSPLDEIPDPLEDPCFESMKKNPEFKKIAKKIAKENKRIDREFEKATGMRLR